MAMYTVEVFKYIDVEADSEDEAYDLAYDQAAEDGFEDYSLEVVEVRDVEE